MPCRLDARRHAAALIRVRTSASNAPRLTYTHGRTARVEGLAASLVAHEPWLTPRGGRPCPDSRVGRSRRRSRAAQVLQTLRVSVARRAGCSACCSCPFLAPRSVRIRVRVCGFRGTWEGATSTRTTGELLPARAAGAAGLCVPLRAPAEALRNLPLPHPGTARATDCRRERVRALCVLSGGPEHTVETPRAPRLPSASSTVEASLVPVSRSLRRLQRAVRSGQGIGLLTAARAPPARSLADPSTSPRPHTPGAQRRRVCRASRPLTVAKSRFAAQTLTLTLTPTQALTLALTLSACRCRCRQAVADGGHAGRAAGQPRASGAREHGAREHGSGLVVV